MHPAVDAFLEWQLHWPTSARSRSTATAYARLVNALVNKLATRDGADEVLAMLDESATKWRERWAPSSLQRVSAWREFLAFVHCAPPEFGSKFANLPYLPRSPVHQTAVGTALNETIGSAVRLLCRYVPANSVPTLTLWDVSALPPAASGAVAKIVQWGWASAVYRYGTEKDYRKLPLLPKLPGGRDAQTVAIVADLASRLPFPNETPPPTLDPFGAVFVCFEDQLRARLSNGGVRPVQLPPDGATLKRVAAAARKENAMLRPLAEPKMKPRPVEPEIPDQPPQEPQPRAAWSLSLNLSDVRAEGEPVPRPSILAGTLFEPAAVPGDED